MSKRKRICLLGFAQEAENKIKNIIQSYANTISFDWVSANDKSLDAVVINAAFLEVSQIKKYMSMISCPVVCAHGNSESAKLAATLGLHSISWAENHIDAQQWFAQLIGETGVASSAKQETIVSTTVANIPKPKIIQGDTDKTGKFLKKIRQGEKVILRAVCGESITWIKPSEKLVYINYSREKVFGYDLWKWDEEALENDIPVSARPLKLDVWLFETLWQSHLDGSEYINKNAHFRLLRWPQPLGRNGRTEALRLVACVQAYPVTIKTLQEKTNYSLEQINRFLFASVTAGYMQEMIGHVEVPISQRPQMDEKEKQEKRSLLQRFRAKLGL